MLRNLALAATLVLALAALLACGDDDSSQPACVGASCYDTSYPDTGPDVTNNPDPDAGECDEGELLVDGVCKTTPFPCDLTNDDSCGGDLVGAWTYVDSCALETPFNPYASSCGAGVVAEYWYYDEYDGTLTFDAAGTYHSVTTATTYSVSSMPISCGGYQDCDRLASSWGLGQCTEADQLCECSDSEASVETDDIEGTYTVVNNTSVVFDGDQFASPYCVQGNSLFLRRANIDTYEPLLFERVQ